MSTAFNQLRPSAAHSAPMRALAINLGATTAILVAGTSLACAGADASHWDGDARSAVRLVAGAPPVDKSTTATTTLHAGVEVRLKPGWHTYWRYPGDAGVPPRFDFAGSQNVKSVDVLWPAPQAIPEEGLTVIGYTENVILPLAVAPQNRAKPVTLRLKLDYAVCEKLCVPAEAKAELELTAGPSSQDAAP